MEQSALPAGTRSPTPPEDARLAEAKRRVAAIKGFYVHLTVFVAVMLGLVALNTAIGRPWWVQWVFLGWGIGVLAHALAVFGRGSKFIADWERRKIKELLDEK